MGEKEGNGPKYSSTIPTNPLFSFMILLPCRSFFTFVLIFRATSKANLSWLPGAWCVRMAKEKSEECGRREKEILVGSVGLPTFPIGLSEKAGMRKTDWNRKGEKGKQREGIPVAWHVAP